MAVRLDDRGGGANPEAGVSPFLSAWDGNVLLAHTVRLDHINGTPAFKSHRDRVAVPKYELGLYI